jgi:mannose-6-phosphate isomerase-like protein (cupin superfamily)
MKEKRAWGCFTILDEQQTHKVKRIVVTPGKRLSYQYHLHRSEHWFIISGQGFVTLDDQDHLIQAGDAVDVPAWTAHRIANPGPDPLVFVEVQHGTFFGEEDIFRLDDDYGRATVTDRSSADRPAHARVR